MKEGLPRDWVGASFPVLLKISAGMPLIQASRAAGERHGNAEQFRRGLVYTMRFRLLKPSIRVAGRVQPIGPGLAVQAEIRKGDRRIIRYLLSPARHSMEQEESDDRREKTPIEYCFSKVSEVQKTESATDIV
ncbi:hypothetical protein [Sphingopyxis sp. MWB1]|uniref:hypothetical protein n=1 Tax=Sphingopyxis sp. MWB1 TaxID=1537715 RepID=UPI001184F486|nr:hypothetical protein [Sphingopyxis sp. MWB1]